MATPVGAQIVQFKESALDGGTVTMDAPITTGSTVVVVTRSCDPGYIVATTVSDPANTYALAGTRTSAANATVLSAYYKVNVTGGQTVITNTGMAGCYMYTFAAEISAAYGTFGSFVSATGTGVTDVTSAAITTTGPALLFTFAGQNTFTTYTAGANYTIIDGGIVGAGGAEYYVAASPLTAYVSTIVSDSSNVYAALTMSFLTSGGGLSLKGAGR